MNKRAGKKNSYIIDNGVVWMELPRREKSSLWTQFSEEDLEKVLQFPYMWFSHFNPNNNQYYVTANVYKKCWRQYYDRTLMRLHTYLMLDRPDAHILVDHINHDSLDNRRENLRIASYQNNSQNRKKCNSNSKSGVRNVALINGRYVVQLQIDGKNTRLGSYDNLDEASIAASVAREKYYKEYAGG